MTRAVPLLRLLTGALLASSAACTRREIAPSYDTIVTSTDERAGNPPTHVLYVENHSTAPVTVFRAGFAARAPGRTMLTVALVDEAQRMLGQTVGEVGVPIIVVDSLAEQPH